MSTHKIIFHLELTDGTKEQQEETLLAIRAGMIRNATEDYGIREYEDGKAVGDGGYEGPFITRILALSPDF